MNIKQRIAQRNLKEAFTYQGHETKPYDTQATVTKVEDDTAWAHIPGGISETPVQRTIDAKAGDTVTLRVSGGSAWITGNLSSPPTDDTAANDANDNAKDAKVTAVQAQGTADGAKSLADKAGSAAENAANAAGAAGTAAKQAAAQADQAKTDAANALNAADPRKFGYSQNITSWTSGQMEQVSLLAELLQIRMNYTADLRTSVRITSHRPTLQELQISFIRLDPFICR